MTEIVEKCTDKISDSFLQKMHASKNREEYAKRIIRPSVDDILFKRRFLQNVSNNAVSDAFTELVSDAVDTIEQETEGYGSFTEIKKAYWNYEYKPCCPYCGAEIEGIGYTKCAYCWNLVETD